MKNNLNYKSYKKEQRKYTKALCKLAKQDGPFEWSYMLDIIELMIKRRLEYFSLGHNVWQEDKSRLEVVEELQECLNRLQTARKGFSTFMEDTKPYCKNEDNILDYDIPESVHGELSKKWAQQELDQQKAYEDAFLYLATNMQKWWD